MKLETLNELLHNNIGIIKTIDGYKSILNRGNNLLRFDVLNRILIAIQDNKAYDLKTNEEWLLVGRELIKKSTPIYIALPKTSSQYIDTKTGEVIKNGELSQEEILKAIEYNIIKREDNISELYALAVYDIRQTKKLNTATEYKVNKPVLNSTTLLKLLSDITGASIEVCDESYYSKSDNTIFIQKKPYKELAYTIAEFINQYYIEFKLKDIITNTFNFEEKYFNEQEYKLIKISLLHSLVTLFASEANLSFDIINSVEINKLIDILNIVDNIITYILPFLSFTTNDNIGDAITNIKRIRKSEIILDIMEANNIYNKINNN